MSARTYGPEEQAKLKKIIDEGATVLSEVEDLMKKGTIDEEEYKYMRKKILTKYVN